MTKLARALFFATALLPMTDASADGPIGASDFDPGSTTINFDAVSGFLDGSEFGPGIHLRSGTGVAPAEDAIPADYVTTNTEFPSAMSSPPHNIRGAAEALDGSLLECKFCSIIVEFDVPRAQVGLWVTDPDNGQVAAFFGPAGSLAALTLTSANSGTAAFLGYEASGGISRVEVRTIPWLGVGIDDLTFSQPIPEPSTALLLGLGVLALALIRR